MKIKLKESERILNQIHRYGLTFSHWWFLIIILFGVPFFFMFWLFQHDWWGQMLFIIPVVLGLLVSVRTIFLWQKNKTIITTHRVIDIDRRGFFEEAVSEIPYDQIEDVSGRIKGIFGMIFNYGNVEIETASSKTNIILEKIKQPVHLQQQINELRERYLSRHSHEFSGDVAGVIIDKLYELEIEDLMKVRKALVKIMKRLKNEE